MNPLSVKRQASPVSGVRQRAGGALYFLFTLSSRDVEELMAKRAIEVSREAAH